MEVFPAAGDGLSSVEQCTGESGEESDGALVTVGVEQSGVEQAGVKLAGVEQAGVEQAGEGIWYQHHSGDSAR